MPVFMKSGAKGIAREKLQDAMLAIATRTCRGRGRARHGARRRLRAGALLRAPRRRDGKLHGAGRGRRRADPGGGGLAYIARARAEMAQAGNADADIFAFLRDGFTNAAMAKVGTSALESRRSATCSTATSSCRTRTSCSTSPTHRSRRWPTAASGRRRDAVPGRRPLGDRHDQGAARQHARRRLHQRPRLPHLALIADVVTGGDIDAGSLVNEEYLMTLERDRFVSLLDHPKTQERIMGMLQTGKPVRN
jgi:3-hydroxyacyl-CoA dehydrogenase